MYRTDNRIVVTLDAGGTNFVFGAMKGCEYIVPSICHPSKSDDLDKCLDVLVVGFSEIISMLEEKPVAISFAFPGPADYPNGIIGGYLPNFPSFRDGVALGPFLEERFEIPVFINNDGNLFAYGEALGGVLPDINRKLEEAGSTKRYKNLIGVTIGTGFGCGVVIDSNLLLGDNDTGGDIWCFRNSIHSQCIAEESVSIRAVLRVYKELSKSNEELTPKDIYDIAEGARGGDCQAAKASFAELGKCAGDALATAVTIVDGIIVVGGGVIGASKYIVPSLIEELNGKLGLLNGEKFNRLQMEVLNLDNEEEFEKFVGGNATLISVPRSDKKVVYDQYKRTGVTISKIGASYSISIGAYIYALTHL